MANTMREKRHRICKNATVSCSNIFVFLFLVMLIIIAATAGTYLFRNTSPKIYLLLYVLLPWFFLILCNAVLERVSLNPYLFAIILFIISLVSKISMAMLIQTPPESDFYLLYFAAQELADGNNILNTTQYFQFWAYQSGFVVWMSFFIRFFNAGLQFFLIMNALAVSITNVLLYFLCRRFGSDLGATIVSLIYLCYPAPFFMVPVLTNQTMAELFMMGALCLYLIPQGPRKKRCACHLGAGILLAISNIFRPMAVVLVFSVLGVTVLCIITRRNFRAYAIPCAFFCGGYIAITQGASFLICASGINTNGLNNMLPTWKFVLGLNSASSGRYSSQDAAYVFGSNHPVAAAQELLRDRLSFCSIPQLLRLFWEKIIIMWGYFEDSSWALTQRVMDMLRERGLYNFVRYWVDKWCRLGAGAYIMIMILAGAGAKRIRGKLDYRYVVVLASGIYFGAHLLVEIQVRYRSTFLLFLLPLTACGVDSLKNILTHVRMHKRLGD